MRVLPRGPWEAVNAVVITALIVTNLLLLRENAVLRARAGTAGEGSARPEVRPGDRLAPLDLVGLDGVEQRLFSRGDTIPRMLFVFTTSCPHCRRNIPAWNRLFALRGGSGPEIVGVSLDGAGETRAFVAGHGIGFPVGSAVDADYARAQGVAGVPSTLFVGPEATVKGAWTGEIDANAFVEIARLLIPGPGR